MKLSRSNTFQIDVEDEQKSKMKNHLKKKFLYNPLGYFKRSKTYDWDETEYSPTVKEEIQKLLDEKMESPKNSNETDNEIVSLRNIDSEQTLVNF